MKIACLGWGSLIWQPGNLLIQREWFLDGPLLPIEFCRQSKDGRLTLVITENAKPVRTLWAFMATDDLNKAKLSLSVREGISKSKIEDHIGAITVLDEVNDPFAAIIKEWATTLKLDAVIWTNLPPKFREIERAPRIEEAITYIQSLDINSRQCAETYIRRAPKQIDTEYRRKFEVLFGWTYLS